MARLSRYRGLALTTALSVTLCAAQEDPPAAIAAKFFGLIHQGKIIEAGALADNSYLVAEGEIYGVDFKTPTTAALQKLKEKKYQWSAPIVQQDGEAETTLYVHLSRKNGTRLTVDFYEITLKKDKGWKISGWRMVSWSVAPTFLPSINPRIKEGLPLIIDCPRCG